jgi:lipoprotein NlpD
VQEATPHHAAGEEVAAFPAPGGRAPARDAKDQAASGPQSEGISASPPSHCSLQSEFDEPAVLSHGPDAPAPRCMSTAWPTDGAVLATVTQPMGGLGLRLGGTTGATVRAAANGRVVYVGSGLRAYGLLVIVKHDESWLSAYGYNREVLVHEGDAVREGQAIASMGEGPGGSPMLYFEIRLQGKPVDPLKHLPSR